MDPFLALYSWLDIRGTSPGPIFCDIRDSKAGSTLGTTEQWSSKRFTDLLRNRLMSIGIGSEDAKMYSSHSIKRGSVQLH